MAKAAMETACRALAFEEREFGIHVNVVAPGLVATDMGARLVGAGGVVNAIEGAVPDSPFGRVCTPADVAAVVGFLACPASGYVTGARVPVDGGGGPPTIY